MSKHSIIAVSAMIIFTLATFYGIQHNPADTAVTLFGFILFGIVAIKSKDTMEQWQKERRE